MGEPRRYFVVSKDDVSTLHLLSLFTVYYISILTPMEVKISAAEVNKLRQMTGAGMMDCKKALVEANGDFDTAIEGLRKKGQKLANNRADREAKEGVCIALAAADGTKGIVVQLSCETDFVAKNADFVAFATMIAEAALAHFPADTEALLALPMDGETVGAKIVEQIGVIGEKIEVAQYARLESALVVPYIHTGNRAAVILGLSQAGNFAEAGRNLAMQVTAMRPVAVDKDGVDSTTIEKELDIARELARNEGKPEAMLDKIAQGRLQKFYAESTLMNQEYVRDPSMVVRAYLDGISKGLVVTAFTRVALG